MLLLLMVLVVVVDVIKLVAILQLLHLVEGKLGEHRRTDAEARRAKRGEGGRHQRGLFESSIFERLVCQCVCV